MKKNITVYGLGSFWYAFLKYLDTNNESYNLSWFDRKTDTIQSLQKYKKHNIFHTNYEMSNRVSFFDDEKKALKDCDILILAITSNAIIDIIKKIKKYFTTDILIINTAKALSPNWITYSQEIKSILKNMKYSYCVLSWWTIASDLFMWYPLWATIATKEVEKIGILKQIFSSWSLEIEFTTDVIGTEYAGVFKNVGSILAWYIYGKWLPYGTETLYLVKFAKEILKLSETYLSVDPHTFSIESQCWWNDYWMSCTGNTRNREFGILLWKWVSFANAVEIMKLQNKSIEWVNTLNSLEKIFQLHKIKHSDFPLIASMLTIEKDSIDVIIKK